MNANDSDRTHDLIARIVNVFEQTPTPPRPSNEATIEAISQYAKLDSTAVIPLHRRRIMKIMAPVAALAASIVLIVTFWPAPQNVVFAQVIEQLKKVDAVTFAVTLQRPGFPKITGKGYAESPDLQRFEFEANGQTAVNIYHLANGEMISFDSASKEATVWKIPAEEEEGVDIVRRLREMKIDSATRLVETDGDSDPNTDVFEVRTEGVTFGKVWVDKQTKLPTRIEMQPPPGSQVGGAIYSDFDWNATIADSMFAVPAGYTVVRNNLLAEPTEEELVAAFRIRQAFSEELYPADFLANDAGLAVGRLAYDGSLSGEENHQRRLAVLGPFLAEIGLPAADAQDAKKFGQRIDYLCMKLDQWDSIIRHSGGAWVGEGVRPGEDKPLCWWRKRGAEKVRVLYADLTIRDADQPPQSK